MCIDVLPECMFVYHVCALTVETRKGHWMYAVDLSAGSFNSLIITFGLRLGFPLWT